MRNKKYKASGRYGYEKSRCRDFEGGIRAAALSVNSNTLRDAQNKKRASSCLLRLTECSF